MAGNDTEHPRHPMTEEKGLTRIVLNLETGKFGDTGKRLAKALKKRNEKEAKELSTAIIVGSVDSKTKRSKLTNDDLKLFKELADKEKLRQDLKLKGCDTFRTASGDIFEEENTSIDSGPSDSGKTSKQKGAKPAEPSSEHAPKEEYDIKIMQKLLSDRVREIDELRKEIHEKEESNKHTLAEKADVISKLQEQLQTVESEKGGLIASMERMRAEHEKNLEAVETEKKEWANSIGEEYRVNAEKIIQRNIDEAEKRHSKEIKQIKEKLKEITEERDDLKTRFSKLAGQRLTDQNADIADLSDPNRAMKLSDRFGQLYDDEWTDAFECLKKKKMAVQDAITLLKRMLKDCLEYCTRLKDEQMDSLKNVLLYPSQEMSQFSSEPSKNIARFKERPRISSKDQGAVYEVRRKIGVYETVINEVKRRFVQETKTWDRQGYDKKHIENCSPYLEKCVEICWLMKIHCPPLYIKLDVKQGDPLDLNYFSNYTTPSEKIEYLVWPPLFSEERGGLLKKGVAEGMKDARKK